MIPVERKVDADPTLSRPSTSLYSWRSLRFAVCISAAYLAVSYLLIGFKGDQLVLMAIFNCLYFASGTTRRFILAFSIFIVYWIIFDYMKAFPNYRYNSVHIKSLYEAEKNIFGFLHNGVRITPNEFFAFHHTSFADILAGVFYLCWVPVPLAFAAWLFFRNKAYFFQFSLTFFLVNIIGFIGYYLYPAAPPWYVAQHGFDFLPGTPGNTAGLSRFDSLTGTSIFAGIYSKSSNVFAAMPSLHAAYMLIVAFFSYRLRLGIYTLLFSLIMLGIWFAAVYSSHHYILDVLAGIGCSLAGIALFQFYIRQTNSGKALISSLLTLTNPRP